MYIYIMNNYMYMYVHVSWQMNKMGHFKSAQWARLAESHQRHTVLFKDHLTSIRKITINWSRQLTGPSAATCMALWWVSCDAQTRFSESSHAYQHIYSMRSPSRLVGQAMFSLVSIFSILYMQNIPIFYCSYWRHHDLAPSRQDVDSAVLDQRAKHEDHAREHPDVNRLDVGHSAIVTHSHTWRQSKTIRWNECLILCLVHVALLVPLYMYISKCWATNLGSLALIPDCWVVMVSTVSSPSDTRAGTAWMSIQNDTHDRMTINTLGM